LLARKPQCKSGFSLYTTIIFLLDCLSGSHPSCYEVRVDAPSQKMPVLSLRCAASRPGKGDAVCSLVPMRHADNSIDIAQGTLCCRLIAKVLVGSALLHCCALTTHMQKLVPYNRYTLNTHTFKSLSHTTRTHDDFDTLSMKLSLVM